MSSYEYDERRNGEGVPDPTPFQAIRNIERERKRPRPKLEERIADLEKQMEGLRKRCASMSVRLDRLEGRAR